MKAIALPIALVALLAGVSAPLAANDPARDVTVTQIVVAADYAVSHVIFAAVQPQDCSGCTALLRSRDGGATWTRVAARGWEPGPTSAAFFDGRAVLVTSAGDHVEVSRDLGESFVAATAPGAVNDTARRDRGVDAFGLDGSGRPFVASLPAATVRHVTGAPDLAGASLFATPAYTQRADGAPYAVAIGTPRGSNTVRLEPCDAALACSGATTIAQGGIPMFSPAFATDLTMFLLTPSGLQRSGDGGRTLAPVTVAPPAPGGLAAVVDAIAFTPDFDGGAPRGWAFAAVLGATRDTGGGGHLTGGVYGSRDGGLSWGRVGDAAALASGATSIALAPDGRLLAGSLHFQGSPGGIHCSTDHATWATACPAYATSAGRPGAPPPPVSLRQAAGATEAASPLPARPDDVPRVAAPALAALGGEPARLRLGEPALALVAIAAVGCSAWRLRRRPARRKGIR